MTMAVGPSKPFILVCLIANIVMAISIVLVNKSLYRAGFPNVTLTFIHFVFTTVGMVLCNQAGVFHSKRVDIKQMIPVALTFCGFVVFTNLSLLYNTVGTYQVIKSLTTPCVIFLQTYFYNRSFSTRVKLTLIPIIIGVYLNSYYDIQFSLTGVSVAGIGVLVTSLYQVWVAEKQKELSLNAMQLLFYQAPLSALFLLFVIPITEPVMAQGGLFGVSWDFKVWVLMTLSGLIAFGINLSIYWIIGNTSALTYNMVGQFKISMVLMCGYLIFKDPLNYLQFVGISLTFGGVFIYSWLRMKEQEAEKLENANKTSALKEVMFSSPERTKGTSQS